jgi:WD40 repeat protein
MSNLSSSKEGFFKSYCQTQQKVLPSTGSRILVPITLPDAVFLPSEHASPSNVTVPPALLSIHSFTLFPPAFPAPLFTTGMWKKGLLRLKHYEMALSIAFSPDGKLLALAAEHNVTLWDPTTGKLLHRLRNYTYIAAVAFSPNGKQLVLAADHDITLWDTATGKPLHGLRVYWETVAVAFSPDGKQLVLATNYHVTLWDTATGKQLHRLRGYRETVAVAFLPDGKQLVLLTERDVTLWDTATGKQLHRFESYGDTIAVTFSPDGKQLSSISTNLATSSTAAESTRTRTIRLPYDFDNAKDIGKIDFLHDAGKPMTQVRNALSYVGGGSHTVNIDIESQLPEFVRDSLDKRQDLATVLTITGKLDKAYVCSYEDYVKLV